MGTVELTKQVALAGTQSRHDFEEEFEAPFDFSRLRLLSNQRLWRDRVLIGSQRRRAEGWFARHYLRPTIILTADLVGVGLSALFAVGLGSPLLGDSDWAGLEKLWPSLGAVALIYVLLGIERTELVNTSRELRRHTLSSLALMLGFVLVILGTQDVPQNSWRLVLVAWLLSLGLVPMMRSMARRAFCSSKWWGHPVLVFGAGPVGRSIVATLIRRPELGLRPVTVHDGNSHHVKQFGNVPVVSDLTRTRAISEALGVRHAIVTPELVCKEGLATFFEEEAPYFDHLIIVPDSVGLSRLLFSSDGLHRLAAQASSSTARSSMARLLKRTIDVTAAFIIGLFAFPIMLLVAIASKLTSPGPVLFGHRRIGQGGREFRVWKFRSMVTNGDAVLKNYLERNPKARDEWERTQKLCDDPRITPLGRILRKTSLDELPQLWNVLVGDMSLIGPRPIIRSECHHYGKHIELYKSVPPGLSGLWQVSGRSDTSYEERVQLDASYVLNWSVWLDLCILVRTIPSMLGGHGAR